MGIASRIFHFLTNTSHLTAYAFTGIFFIQIKGGLFGKCRTILPNRIHKVLIIENLGFLFLGNTSVFLSFSYGYGTTVKGKGVALLQMLLQEGLQTGYSRLEHLHQFNGGSFQLLSSLDKITTVSPKSCFL